MNELNPFVLLSEVAELHTVHCKWNELKFSHFLQKINEGCKSVAMYNALFVGQHGKFM